MKVSFKFNIEMKLIEVPEELAKELQGKLEPVEEELDENMEVI